MSLISEKAKSIKEYTAGEQPKGSDWIKLNTNENPYPPDQAIFSDTFRASVFERLRLYPDPECSELRQTIADLLDLKIENIFAGNGSDEIIALLFPALFNPQANKNGKGKYIAFPDYTYSFYRVYADMFNIPFKAIPLDSDFRIDVEDYLSKKEELQGIILANPNAPTGIALGVEEIERLLKECPEIPIVIDEAYIDFSKEGITAMPLVLRYKNLVVVRTLSKSYSLAGLRVGYCVGGLETMGAINKMKNCFNSYTVDYIAQKTAAAALRLTYQRENSRKIIKTREWFTERLRESGIRVLDSEANFVFAEFSDAERILDALKAERILVRRFDIGRIKNFLRITIGTDQEMECLLDVLKQVLVF